MKSVIDSVNRFLRPASETHYYWFDSVLGRGGYCHVDDWPVEWESSDSSIALVVPVIETVHRIVSAPEGMKLDALALAYSVEDTIAGDVSEFHWLSEAAQGSYRLIGVRVSWLSHWRDYVASHEASLAFIGHELDLLPASDTSAFVGPEVVVRHRGDVYALEMGTFSQLVESQNITHIKQLIVTELAKDSPTNITNMSQESYWANLSALRVNLAIGSFKPPLPWRRWSQRFGWIAACIMVVLFVELIYGMLTLSALKDETRSLQQAQLELAQRTFPQAQFSDPYLQIMQMAEQGPAIELSDVTQLLLDIGAIKESQLTTLKLSSLELRDGNAQFVLSLNVDNFSDVDRFNAALESRGYSVRTLASQARDGATSARIAVGI